MTAEQILGRLGHFLPPLPLVKLQVMRLLSPPPNLKVGKRVGKVPPLSPTS